VSEELLVLDDHGDTLRQFLNGCTPMQHSVYVCRRVKH
jgi:hypothetical protein